MGAFPSGVTVVTGRRADGPVGVTVSSFASVSLQPPLALVCISRRSASLPAFGLGAPVVVNVLAHDQRWLAERFAARSPDRFEGVEHHMDERGVSRLDGSAAMVSGTVEQVHEGGDHLICVLALEQVERYERRPLLYHSGAFHEWIQA